VSGHSFSGFQGHGVKSQKCSPVRIADQCFAVEDEPSCCYSCCGQRRCRHQG